MDKQLVKFDIETAVITALDERYKNLVIHDGKSYAFVMSGLAEYRELRLSVVKGHKKEKEEAKNYCDFLDSEKRRILERLALGENYLKEIRQVWDDQKAAIKAEKARKEAERIESIQENIISLFPLGVPVGIDAAAIENRLNAIRDIEIDPQVFMEFSGQAQAKKEESITALEDAYEKRVKWEAEEVERKAEAVRLAEERKANEAKEKELAEERRKIDEEKRRLERLEFEQKANAQAKEWAEREAKEKAEREERERKAAEAEKKRQEALRPDKDKLIAFADGLYNMNTPALNSSEAKEILGRALDGITTIVNNIVKDAKEL